jgi:thiamine-monophosphate kinase
VFGGVPPAQALRRDRARVGDDLWVSGTLGAAAWALDCRLQAGSWPTTGDAALSRARGRLERPEPRVALGLALRGLAHAAIDLSDGLAGDIGHVLERSSAEAGVTLGARLEAAALPVDPALDGLPEPRRLELALAGGDDYELLFTAPASARGEVLDAGARIGLTLSRIGRIEAAAGLRLHDPHGRPIAFHARSFDHVR